MLEVEPVTAGKNLKQQYSQAKGGDEMMNELAGKNLKQQYSQARDLLWII